MVYIIQVCWQLASRVRTERPDPPRIWHIPLLCVQWKTSDDGQRNCLKHVEFYSKNKFDKLAFWSCSQAVWHIPLLCVQWKTPDDGQRNSPKHVVLFQNKFEKLPSWSCSQAVWHIPLLCVQWKTRDDGQRNCPKHVEFYSKIILRNLCIWLVLL